MQSVLTAPSVRLCRWEMFRKMAMCFLFGILMLPVRPVAGWTWNTIPDIPGDDPRWQAIETMWDHHWDGKNIDDMIDVVKSLEKDYPDRYEPMLWMGKLLAIKGHYYRKEGLHYLKKAEGYAHRVLQKEPDNVIAFKILLDVLPYIGDLAYAKANYGGWIEKMSPLETGHVVPPMTGNKEWEEAIDLWMKRAGGDVEGITEEGLEGISRFNRLADNAPESLLANAWACRANYDTGQYYSSVGKHEKVGFKYYNASIEYGKKALFIDPNFLPARYWSMLSQARLIQNKSVLTKARYINFMISNCLYGLREDSLYNYFGHSLALATIITNGGWAAEQGIKMVGYDVNTLLNQLWLAHTVYPTKLYALYGIADLYAHKGDKEKAQEVLDKIFSMDTDTDPLITLENRSVVRFSKKIQQEISKK